MENQNQDKQKVKKVNHNHYLRRIDVAFTFNGKHVHKVLKSNQEYIDLLNILLEALRVGDKIDNYLVMSKGEIESS